MWAIRAVPSLILPNQTEGILWIVFTNNGNWTRLVCYRSMISTRNHCSIVSRVLIIKTRKKLLQPDYLGYSKNIFFVQQSTPPAEVQLRHFRKRCARVERLAGWCLWTEVVVQIYRPSRPCDADL
jgi:hypothetical protein